MSDLVRRSGVIFHCRWGTWPDSWAVGSKRSGQNNRRKFHPNEPPTAHPQIMLQSDIGKQIACIEREWPPFMQWHRIWLTPSYIEYIALTTAVPFNTGHPSAVSRSRQLKVALQVFSRYKVPLTFRYSWKRLRKRRSKNRIKFPQV